MERGSAVRRALGEVEADVGEGVVTLDQAAARIVAVVEEYGLQPVDPPPLPEKVGVDDLRVVCWMAVLSEATSP